MKKTLDEQIFGQFKIKRIGEIEERKEWTDRFDEDPNLKIPSIFNGVVGVDMKKLLKRYPLLGQEYQVLTGTEAELMLKQIDEEGYIAHVYRLAESDAVKQIQIYAHKDFIIKKEDK